MYDWVNIYPIIIFRRYKIMSNKNFEGLNLDVLKRLIDERGSIESFSEHCEHERDAYYAIIKKHENDKTIDSRKICDVAKAYYDAYDALYRAAKMIDESTNPLDKLEECLDYISGTLLNLDGDTKKMAKFAMRTAIMPFLPSKDGGGTAIKLEISYHNHLEENIPDEENTENDEGMNNE